MRVSEIQWKHIGVFLCVAAGVYCQTTVDLRTQVKNRQHAGTHQYGGNDEVGTATPTPHAIPESDGSGQLSPGWLPDLSGTYQPLLGFLPLNHALNLSDLTDPNAARNNLGLGAAARKSFDGVGAMLPSATGPFATNAVPSRDATGTLVDSGCIASNGTLSCGYTSPTRLGVRQGSAPTDATIGGLSNDAVFYLDSADGNWKMRTSGGTIFVLSGATTITSFLNAQHNHSSAAQGGPLGEAAFQFSDVTAGDASSAAHGFLPKLPNNPSLCLRGDGTYGACGVPGGSSGQVQINLGGVFGGLNVSGNGTVVATSKGALSTGHCVTIDSAGNFVDSGSGCASGTVNNSGALNAGDIVSGAGGTAVQDGGFAVSDVQRLSQTQTVAGNRTYTGKVDASGASHTLPAKAGTAASKPSTCTVGEEYFATDATAGQNLYYCTAANTWTQQSGSGSGVSNSGALNAGDIVSGAGGTAVQDGGFAVSDVQRLSQTQIVTGNRTYTGRVDASGASHTVPSKTGLAANLPGSCAVGEEYFATDAAAGQNKYYCTAANTWTQQSGSGGSGVGTMFGAASGYMSLSTGATYIGLSQPGSMASSIGQLIPAACTAKRLYVRPAAAINSSGPITVALFNASTGADTALVVTLPAGGSLQTYSNLSDSVVLTAGQMYSLHFNNQSGAVNSGYWSWGLQCQ